MANKTIRVTGTQGPGFNMTVSAGKHRFSIDQPQAGGGNDEGPTPLEYLAGSLAGCLGAIARIMAHQRKIELRGLDFEVEGELDMDGLLGKPTEQRVGFQGFTVKVKLDAALSDEEKKAFAEEMERRCPVSENLSNATPVHVVAE